MKLILAIYRAAEFSPNSVEKDIAILETVAGKLRDRGYCIKMIKEEQLTLYEKADIIITMGRHKQTLNILKEYKTRGTLIINSPESIESCARSAIDRIMRSNGIPVAPTYGGDGYWIKRGDEAAQSKDDVMFAADETEKEACIENLRSRGITDIIVTAHIKGDLVKFYGVRNTGFFRTYYPNDDGISKFGDELINGQPRHYVFSKDEMQHDAEKTATLTDIDIYGGDCIVREDGTYAIIDFNDWPSFSRCREEAAEAIAERIAETACSYQYQGKRI